MPKNHPELPPFNGGESVQFLPAARLRTTYSQFRSCGSLDPDCLLKPLPLRVVAADDGHFEVIDGFKRLASWLDEGRSAIPVVIESPGTRADHKHLLLQANAPRPTLSPLDEACIVFSLIDEDGLTVTAVSKLLGRKKEWVLKRRALATHLSDSSQQALVQGQIGPTLAHHLTGLAFADQDGLLKAANDHRLSAKETMAFIQIWRLAETPSERQHLLSNPLDVMKPAAVPTLSVRAQQLEHRLHQVSDALSVLRDIEPLTDLPPAEGRRLDALYQSVCRDLAQTAVKLNLVCSGPTGTVKIAGRPERDSTACNLPLSAASGGNLCPHKESVHENLPPSHTGQAPLPLPGSQCPGSATDHRIARHAVCSPGHRQSHGNLKNSCSEDFPRTPSVCLNKLGQTSTAEDRFASGSDCPARDKRLDNISHISGNLGTRLQRRPNDAGPTCQPDEGEIASTGTSSSCQTSVPS